MSLKMWANEVDWYIAESAEQAIEAWEKLTGMNWQKEYGEYDEWLELAPEESLTVHCELQEYNKDHYPESAERERFDGMITMKATVAEWCEHASEPGFLCSTEY